MDVGELYQQLRTAQAERAQLMRWKLAVVAGVGAPALGFSGSTGPTNAYLALAVIPLACLYVDLLCRDLSIRTKRISTFLAREEHDNELARECEGFYQSTKEGPTLETLALVGSTVVASLIVGLVGWVLSGASSPDRSLLEHRIVFGISTGVGVLGSLVLKTLYASRLGTIRKRPAT